MKKYLSIILILIISGNCNAEDRIKEAERFLALSGTKLLMDQSTDMLLAQELESSPELVPFENLLRNFFQKHLSYESMKDELAKLYAEEFTKEELSTLNDFYASEIGQKAVVAIPRLMEKSHSLANRRYQDNFIEFEQMVTEEFEKINSLEH